MESLKIIGLSIAAAVAYGIIHDQITARVCIEYFTVFHPPVFASDSPTMLGLGWGIIATWWVGAVLGVLLALSARMGSRPKLSAPALVRPVGMLLCVMALCALAFGSLGFALTAAGKIVPPRVVAVALPAARYPRFMADWWAHSASYASGCFGGLVLCVWTLRQRSRRLSRASAA